MKTVIVPAQITTIEDVVIGSLTVTQLITLAIPVFACLVCVVLPPSFTVAVYKVCVVAGLYCVCWPLAIRWHNRLIARHIWIARRYARRPGYYVCDKNASIYDSLPSRQNDSPPDIEPPTRALPHPMPPLDIQDRMAYDVYAANTHHTPRYHISKKGKIYVTVPKIK